MTRLKKSTKPKFTAGDLVFLDNWESLGDDGMDLWYPGHPCYLGRFILILRDDPFFYDFFDLDKGEENTQWVTEIDPFYHLASASESAKTEK